MPVSSGTNGKIRVLVKGAGDLATGVGLALHSVGVDVVMSELGAPTAIRRTACFSEAMYRGTAEVEGVVARRAGVAEIPEILAQAEIPVVEAAALEQALPELGFDAVADAIIAKRNTGTRITDAPFVIALGPGFTAGVDCHAVVETMRGHDLARVYYAGSALPNTGVPGEIMGHGRERVMHTPCAGTFRCLKSIGDRVEAGEIVAYAGQEPVRAQIAGILRGLLPDGFPAPAGMKCADVDPRAVREHCFTASDKARAIGAATCLSIIKSEVLRQKLRAQ